MEILKKHYEPRMDNNETFKVLDWENRDAQYARFGAMANNIDLNGKSLLDVGSGCGDFFGFLAEKKDDVTYTGVDLLEKMVNRAKMEYPDARFVCADIFSDGFSAENCFGFSVFDITYASGIFNLNAGNNEEFLKKAVPVLAKLSGEAFIFNLLDPSSPDRDDNYFYYSPDDAVRLAGPFASEVKIVKGYLANDYTLIGRKNEKI